MKVWHLCFGLVYKRTYYLNCVLFLLFQVVEFLNAKGHYFTLKKQKVVPPSKTLFTSLYNTLMLKYIHITYKREVAADEGSTHWLEEDYGMLVDCLQGATVVELFMKQSQVVCRL